MLLEHEHVKRIEGTELLCEEESAWKYNAPHTFLLAESDNNHDGVIEVIESLHFQEGPIKEVGVNGFANEEVLLMVLKRLEAFQNSPYKCLENEQAMHHIEEALRLMHSRTQKRVARNVEGTSEI